MIVLGINPVMHATIRVSALAAVASARAAAVCRVATSPTTLAGGTAVKAPAMTTRMFPRVTVVRPHALPVNPLMNVI